MTTDPMELAKEYLICARTALQVETKLMVGDDYGVWDALSLTEDALSQVRGVLKSRLPERPIIDRRAS